MSNTEIVRPTLVYRELLINVVKYQQLRWNCIYKKYSTIINNPLLLRFCVKV